MLLTIFVIQGCVSMVSTNLAQIFEATAPAHYTRDTAIAISVYSVASTSARLLSPALLSVLVRRYSVSVSVFVVITSIHIAAQLLLAAATRPLLFVGAALTGAGTGFFWTCYPIVLRDFFGTAHLGAHYKLSNIPDSAAALVFAKLVSQHYYHKATSPGTTTCLGPDCFRWTHLTLVGLCGLAAMGNLLLVWWLRRQDGGGMGDTSRQLRLQ